MIKIKFILFIFVLFALKNNYSQVGKNGGLLWKVSGKGLETPSYLLGTCHIINGNFLKEIPGFDNAFNHASNIMIECGIDSMADPALIIDFFKNIQQFKSNGMLTRILKISGKLITESIKMNSAESQEETQKIEDELTKLKKQLEEIIPNLDSVANSNKIKMDYEFNLTPKKFVLDLSDSASNKAKSPMDLYILTKGKSDGKTISYCESIEKQLACFDSLFMIQNVNFNELLQSALNKKSLFNAQADSLCFEYLKQDIDAMQIDRYLESKSSTNSSESEHILLKHRNLAWIPVINQNMNNGSTFIAVGFAHLLGSYGIIQLLKNQGYTVEPVFN